MGKPYDASVQQNDWWREIKAKAMNEKAVFISLNDPHNFCAMTRPFYKPVLVARSKSRHIEYAGMETRCSISNEECSVPYCHLCTAARSTRDARAHLAATA